jgi:type VI secretion system protein VasG
VEKERLAGLEQRWAEERELVDRILELRRQLRDEVETAEPATREERLTELRGLHSKLTHAQGESPLILPSVDAQAVASVVADWTGVPVGRMVKNEVEAVLKLADTLGARVVGQRHGLEMIAKRIQTSRARLDNPASRSASSFWSGPPAWARPRRPSPWPSHSTGARTTSSPST